MKKHPGIITLVALLLVLPGPLPAAETAKTSAKPNIVYILLDDAGYGDFGCYGQKTLRTPNVDRDVGALMAKLKALNLDETTIVMFSSDNGPHQEGGHKAAFFQSSGGLTGTKRDLTEGGVRVPFIVRWPGKIKPGTVNEHVSGFQDLMPTAADLAGVKVTTECDGISFLPTLLGNNAQQQQHPYLYWNFSEQGGKRSVLKWPWKLLHLNTASGDTSAQSSTKKKKSTEGKSLVVELFNLDLDPTESTNVANSTPRIVEELTAYMQQAWRDPK